MSSALVRQALEFVDQEDSIGSHKKRGAGSKRQGAAGQGPKHQKKHKIKKIEKIENSKEQKLEDNIKKLLALSKPVADSEIAQKIVQRAVKGKPLLEKIEIKKDIQKSILFPDDEETVDNTKRKSFKR